MSTVKDHSMTADIRTIRTFSVIMSAALEFLGYSYTAIKHRQTHFEKIGQIIECPIIVGSKAEGITLCTENDSDVISVLNECTCADDIGDIVINNPGHTLLLLTEMDDLHSGYARIKVPFPDDLSNLHNAHVIPQSSFHAGGDVYLCSALYNSSGLDTVVAIPYRCRVLVQEWIARPRFHGWPSQDTLQQLAKLDWHLVAERSQNADDSYKQWRICFTLGEQHLVKTLHITQLHLLILLRYVIKKSLRAVCTAFSSYIAKTLVFWMVEILAPENFKVENLSSVLMMSLQMLQEAVKNEQLQNYMIPSLNLFKGTLSPHEKIQVMQLLDRFMYDGPSFIFKQSEFEKLQKAMLTVKNDPEFTQRELKRRDKHEKEFLDFIFGLQCRQYKSDTSKLLEECSPVDSDKGDKWVMEMARDYMERQGIKFTEGQLRTVLDGLAGEI